MRSMAITVFTMLFLCAGCATHKKEAVIGTTPKTETGQTTASDLAGVWQSSDSTAKFRIIVRDGRIAIEGWDSADDERFKIIDISLEGKTLRFTTIMPSTNWTVHLQGTIVNSQEMQVNRSGDYSVAFKLIKE